MPPLAPVTGVILLDGKPAVGKQVIFSPEGGRPSIGTTNEQGEYQLMYTVKWEGAIIGNHKVTISTPVPDFDGAPYHEDIPAHYTTDAETPLTAEVKDEDNVINFDLKSDGVPPAN